MIVKAEYKPIVESEVDTNDELESKLRKIELLDRLLRCTQREDNDAIRGAIPTPSGDEISATGDNEIGEAYEACIVLLRDSLRRSVVDDLRECFPQLREKQRS